MVDEPESKPNEVDATTPRRERSIATWLLVGAGLLVMAGGIAWAITLARRSATTAAPPAPPGNALASAPASAPRPPPPPPRAHPSATIAFTPPPPPKPRGPRVTAEDQTAALPVVADMPLWGDSSALVTVMLFGDLDCPHTRRAITALAHLEERFGSDLRVAFRHRPVPTHRTARQAGITAAALHAERGDRAFWSLALELAKRPPPASPARFEAWARRAGEDPSRVAAWAASASASALVDRDFALAVRYGIRKTPTFFVNGERLEGFKDEQALSGAIEHGLAQALEAAGDGIARPALYARLTARNFIGIDAAGRERSCPSPAEAPARGPVDAPVTLVFFADFACQYCQKMVPVVAELAKRFPSDLRVIYKNLPHTDHPPSMRLARFAQEAFARGGSDAFWRVYDPLFALRGEPDDTRLRSIAEAAGLVPAQLLAASRTEGLGSALEAIANEAEALEVDGTPTIFVNGKRFDGVVGRVALARRVTQDSEFGRWLVERGVARARLYDVICPAPKPAEPVDPDEPDQED